MPTSEELGTPHRRTDGRPSGVHGGPLVPAASHPFGYRRHDTSPPPGESALFRSLRPAFGATRGPGSGPTLKLPPGLAFPPPESIDPGPRGVLQAVEFFVESDWLTVAFAIALVVGAASGQAVVHPIANSGLGIPGLP